MRSGEIEKNLKLEHAQLLCKLSNALKGYAESIENGGKSGKKNGG